MEIKNENKFKRYFKKFGALSLACVFAVAIALTIAFSIPRGAEEGEPVTTTPISFVNPMNNAVVVKDYADNKLQHNESLKRWEIHLAVDLSAEDMTVFSVSEGTVASVTTDALEGSVVTINHKDGFVSVYSSLDSELKVKEGDKVEQGQEIGKATNSAGNEAKEGGHLHFTLYKDGQEVDPNNYLDLQNK